MSYYKQLINNKPKVAFEDKDEKKEKDDYDKKNEIIEPAGKEEPEEEVNEKTLIKEYLEPLMGDQLSELTLMSAREVNRPLYHISMNGNIKAFTPQISKRTLSKENRSVPRISTSPSIVGCMNGYQSVNHGMDDRRRNKFDGIFKVYQLPFQYAVRPSSNVVPDVNSSDEYWLISWKKETFAYHPNIDAEFTVPKIETVYGKDQNLQTYHLVVKVLSSSVYLTQDIELKEGYYYVKLEDYHYRYPLSGNRQIEVSEIDEQEYRKIVSMSMIPARRKPQ